MVVAGTLARDSLTGSGRPKLFRPLASRAIMLLVVLPQQIQDHVAHIQDGPVDVEKDQQLIVGTTRADSVVVSREHRHPVVHRGAAPCRLLGDLCWPRYLVSRAFFCNHFVGADHLQRSACEPARIHSHFRGYRLMRPLRIRSLTASVYRVPMRNAIRSAMGDIRDRPGLFVRAEDTEGVVGWGEVWCNFPACGAEHRARLVETM